MTSAPAASETRLRAAPAPEALHALLTAIALLVADICVTVAIEFCRNPRLLADSAPFWRALDQIARGFVAFARHAATPPTEAPTEAAGDLVEGAPEGGGPGEEAGVALVMTGVLARRLNRRKEFFLIF